MCGSAKVNEINLLTIVAEPSKLDYISDQGNIPSLKSLQRIHVNCVKYRNFTYFPVVESLQKGTVSIEFRPKLCGNCVFPQNFRTRKLGEISVFYAVLIITI